MGRKAALSYEQVKAVVNAFRAEGAKPTIDKVWEALDKAGSKGTIHRLVKQCLAESEQAQQTPESLRLLPHDVQQVILAFADRAASAARDSIANELLECTQGAETLASDNERRAAEVEGLREELALLASDKAAAEGRAEQLANELAAARGQVESERAAAEQARTTLARMEMRLEPIGRLEEELRSATTERDAQREARIEAERAVAVLGSQRREHEERISELKSELAIARDVSARGEQKIADLTEGLERGRPRSKILQCSSRCTPSGRRAARKRGELQDRGHCGRKTVNSMNALQAEMVRRSGPKERQLWLSSNDSHSSRFTGSL